MLRVFQHGSVQTAIAAELPMGNSADETRVGAGLVEINGEFITGSSPLFRLQPCMISPFVFGDSNCAWRALSRSAFTRVHGSGAGAAGFC